MQPKVSIVVPVYNVAQYLEKALDSAINQTLQEIEIICVEDGSTDGSAQILKDCESRDARIRCIWHEENMGTFKARKDGILASTGKYVMFLDPDDFLELNACEVAFNAIERHGTDIVQFGANLVSCGDVLQTDLRGMQRFLTNIFSGRMECETNLLKACFLDRNITVVLWNKIFWGERCRTAAFYGEDGNFPVSNDIYLMFLICSFCRSFFGMKEPLYNYCFGNGFYGSAYMSCASFQKMLDSKPRVISAMKRFLETGNAGVYGPEIVQSRENLDTHWCIDKLLNNMRTEDLSGGGGGV